MARKLVTMVMFLFLPSMLFPQSTQDLDIYRYFDVDSPVPDTAFLWDIRKYIEDTLFFGGGKLSNPEYIGSPKGVGLFRDGADVGISDGLIISNGYVKTTTILDGGTNKTGAQAIPAHDSLGPYSVGGAGGGALKDPDMDYMVGIIVGDMKPDTAVDPSVITFKFKPYYASIHLNYVFASEEYLWQADPQIFPPPPVPVDIDRTGATASDFMAILVKRTPSEMSANNIASVRGVLAEPPFIPISVKYLNHTFAYPGIYFPNYYPKKSFIFDGYTVPNEIRPFPFDTSINKITPCRTYWIKIAVADYPNGVIAGGYNLSHQINSAVFLKAYSLMSGYGLEWTMESAIDNPDFAGDTSLVEGGCSNIIVTVKTNVLPRDTMFIRFRVDNADLSDYIVTPPLVQDSLIMIPDSVMEYTFTIAAVDDNINEGSGGIDKWFLRYQMDPCDVPMTDTTGIGTSTSGYSGLIKVKVLDYNPFVNTSKTYGPIPPSIYHCGNDITVSISDILQGGIPPYTYSWSNPPQIGNAETFTTTIADSPDIAICRIFDRCTGKPGYVLGADTVIIYSQLEVQASPDFQLCQNGASDIKVQSTNVDHDFTTIWYFQGNPVGYDSIYTVDWDVYGIYAPNTITFTCVVTDFCGNTDSDEVHATFFPVVEISGVPLICLGFPIQLVCSGAQSYQWYYNSYPGTPIPGATSQTLNYTPPTPGFHTICVSIINDCGEQADTCYTFEVSELICDMRMNNSTNFNTCPNVTFSLNELYAYDGWQWSWFDDGINHTASGQVISLSLKDAGPCDVQVIAYNINGCYDTITRTVTVYPYAFPQASTSIASVCIDYPTQLSIAPSGPVTFVNYYWTAIPPDASLSGQQNSASPTVTPQVTTTYKCRITDNHGCLDSATVEVNVRPRLTGNILGAPDFQCTDKPVQINFEPIVTPLPNATYYWTFDDGVPGTSTLADPPQVVWSSPGVKNISLHIEELGCEETFYFQYTVYPDPLAAFTASGNFGCQPIEVSFNNASSNLENPTYLWDFGDGTTETAVNPTHVYSIPGIYDVTLTVTNSTGCVNTLTINNIVEVYEVPVADFSADPQAATIDNPTIKFTELVNIPHDSIHWDFGDQTSISTEDNPKHTYGYPGIYMVVMYAVTEHGCRDTATLEIGIVEDIKIFVPNAFTPNGDGLNDCFSVSGTTGDLIDVFKIMIFSRWGEQVYESKLVNPDCIWDGKDMDGNLVAGDTYIFRIFGKNIRGAKKVYEGMVTIVK